MDDKKVKQLIADIEKILVVWTEDQTSCNIPLSQSLIYSKAEWGEEAREENFEAWFMRLRKGAISKR